MRLAIFIGLLYVAYCINPIAFDSMTASDGLVIGITVIWCFLFDIIHATKNNK